MFSKYYSNLNLDFISKNYTDIFKLYSVLPRLHASGVNKTYTVLDLKLCVLESYPRFDEGLLDAMLEQVKGDTVDAGIIDSYIRSMSDRAIALDVARLAISVSEGREELGLLKDRLVGIEASEASNDSVDSYRVSGTLDELLEAQVQGNGLRWRLQSMNKALGSIRKGDFGFLFARPESGKTTFLASECSNFATQLKEEHGPIVWFNNEEVGSKVLLRCYSAVLGKTITELKQSDRRQLHDLFLEASHGKIFVMDTKPMTKEFVERTCRQYNPSLLIFDQIDKIKGFTADRNDLELKEVYGWAREMASRYGPVIAVCQAGASGENKQWLTMNDVDSSKTAKQGEADWILGIGQVFDYGKEQVRYFHLSKNKLFGDDDTDPSMRHGRWSTYIEPDIAIYKDFNNDGTIQK